MMRLGAAASTMGPQPRCLQLGRTLVLLTLAAALLAPLPALSADPEEFTTPAGVWKGNYVCSEGGMALTLTLEASPDGALTGIFTFSPSPHNPGTSSGSYTLVGAWRANGELTLSGERWIDKPEGGQMLSLEGQAFAGEPGEPVELAGQVTGVAGCTSWGVSRQ
jgi:hypothetical protein